MLQPRHFFLPLFVLMLTLLLSFIHPSLIWVWTSCFLFFTALFFLLGIFGTLLRLERYLQRQQFAALQKLATPIWLNAPQSRWRPIVGIYLAMAHLGLGSKEGMEQAAAILSAIPFASISPRNQNRYWIAQAQLALYQERPAIALDALKRCGLHPLNLFYLTRLFYYFSVTFYLTEQEGERSLNYARKAYEINPQEPLYRAQRALVTHQLQGDADALTELVTVLTIWPTQTYPWEFTLYQRYAQRYQSSPFSHSTAQNLS